MFQSLGFRCQRLAGGDRLTGHPGPDPKFPEGSDALPPPHYCPKGMVGEATSQERGTHTFCYQRDLEVSASWGEGSSGRERGLWSYCTPFTLLI